MNESYKLNYEAVHEAMRKQLGTDFDVQEEFYDRLKDFNDQERSRKLGLVNDGLMKVDKRDLVLLMRITHTLMDLGEYLCEKYDLDKKGEKKE